MRVRFLRPSEWSAADWMAAAILVVMFAMFIAGQCTKKKHDHPSEFWEEQMADAREIRKGREIIVNVRALHFNNTMCRNPEEGFNMTLVIERKEAESLALAMVQFVDEEQL